MAEKKRKPKPTRRNPLQSHFEEVLINDTTLGENALPNGVGYAMAEKETNRRGLSKRRDAMALANNGFDPKKRSLYKNADPIQKKDIDNHLDQIARGKNMAKKVALSRIKEVDRSDAKEASRARTQKGVKKATKK